MGLDMYLSEVKNFARYEGLAESYPSYKAEFDKATAVLEAAEIALPTVDGSITVKATVMYWRKANEIHQWFVENVQGGVDECQESYVEREQLQELIGLCREVLADHDKAPKLLPTQEGFFFGGTEYDEWYFQDLEETVAGLEAALENAGKDSYFIYQASW